MIQCPECAKEISNKATSCPNCGFPMDANNSIAKQDLTPVLLYPVDLPINLNIGSQIVNFGGDAVLEGTFERNENVVANIKSGKVRLLLHTNGIQITGSFYVSLLAIHNRQLISVKQTTSAELVKIDKSVIGRAAVGALILGPLGAVVGGMSGIGNKEKVQDISYLVLNYWDVLSKKAQTILIRSNPKSISKFIRKWNEVKGPNPTIEQKNNFEKLSDSEKKILEVYKIQGMPEALKIYFQQNNIVLDKMNIDTDLLKRSNEYITTLARNNGVTSQHISSDCFIATACYGNYEAHQVLVLRNYRDNKLLKTNTGRLFVKFYYKTSPFIAEKIKDNEKIKKIIRVKILDPIVSKLEK